MTSLKQAFAYRETEDNWSTKLLRQDKELPGAFRAFSAVIHCIPSPMFVTDTERNLVFLNQACLDFIGQEEESALLGRKCRDVFRADICGSNCPIVDSMEHKSSCNNRKTAITGGRGQTLQISVNASVIIDDQGEVIGAMEVINDISEQINSQIQLTHEKEYTNSVIHGISDPFFIVDQNMVVTYINDAAAQAVGYTVDEVQNKMHCSDVFKSDICQTRCAIKSAMQTGRPIVGARVNLTARDGKQIPILASASVLKNANGEIVGGFELVRDISNYAIEEEVKTISAQLLTVSENLASSAEETAAIAEEMTKSTHSLAKDSEEVTSLSNQTGKTAQEGGTNILKTLEQIEEIFTIVHRLNDNLSEIQKHSMKMGEIISVIDNVAEQTNLLALNAAIEAARAGDQGKGFAVVAEEVRKLAELSARSSKEIAALIYSSQKSIESTSEIVGETIDIVEAVRTGAGEAGQNLKGIVSSIQSVNQHFGSISATTEEISAASVQVSADSVGVSQLAEQLRSLAQELAAAAQRLGA